MTQLHGDWRNRAHEATLPHTAIVARQAMLTYRVGVAYSGNLQQVHGSLGPNESTPQTTFRSVRALLQATSGYVYCLLAS